MMMSGKSALRKKRFTMSQLRVPPSLFGTTTVSDHPRYEAIVGYVVFGTRSGCSTATYGRLR